VSIAQLGVLGHLGRLGPMVSDLRGCSGIRRDRRGDGVAYRSGAMACQRTMRLPAKAVSTGSRQHRRIGPRIGVFSHQIPALPAH
jgi:hypothetical protein